MYSKELIHLKCESWAEWEDFSVEDGGPRGPRLGFVRVSTIRRRWSKRRCLIYASARRSHIYIRKQQKGFMTNPNPNLTLT